MNKATRIKELKDRIRRLRPSKAARVAVLSKRLEQVAPVQVQVKKLLSEDPKIQNLIQTVQVAEKAAQRQIKAVQRELRAEVAAVRARITEPNLKPVLDALDRVDASFSEKLAQSVTTHILLEAEVFRVKQEVDALSALDTDEAISRAIASLERRLNSRLANIGGGNANRNISVAGNSSTLSKYTDINFIAGSNLGISVSTDDTAKTTNFTLTATAAAAGLGYASVSGTVNAVNPTFGYPSAPQAIVGDGVTYFQGNGYTYAASVITMDIPPSQYIKAVV